MNSGFGKFNEEYEASVDEEAQVEAERQRRHPTVEQLFMQEAIKSLSPVQQTIWDMVNYDRLTQAEIGQRLEISQQGVAKHLKNIEAKVKDYVKRNKGVYKALKMEQGEV